MWNLSDLVSGKATVEAFAQGLEGADLSQFEGKIIQIKGCVPTWAYMMAVHKLEGIAAGIEFVGFDGSTIPVYTKETAKI
ncbi:MAG: DUF2480 family protein [bacterium]